MNNNLFKKQVEFKISDNIEIKKDNIIMAGPCAIES